MDRSFAYDIGDLLTIVVRFRNALGQPENPLAFQMIQRNPAGALTTYPQGVAVNPEVGEFRWTMTSAFDRAGVWTFRAEATEGLVSAMERTVRVRPTNFP